MSTINNYINRFEKLKQLKIAAIELESSIRIDMLRDKMSDPGKVSPSKEKVKTAKVAKPETKEASDKAPSVKSVIVNILKGSDGKNVSDIVKEACGVLTNKDPEKLRGQISVCLSSHKGKLFESVSRGVYRLLPS